MAYTLQGSYGIVRFHASGTVTHESKSHSGKLTSYLMESGSKISDHFERDPSGGTLRGILIDGGAAVATLELMHQKGDILTYTGSYREENIVLTKLDFSTDSSSRRGFTFTAGYQKADRVSAQYVELGDTQLMSQQDAGKSEAAHTGAPPASAGMQTTATETISTNAYEDYVNTFDSKPPPSQGPSSRASPTYNGF